MRCILSGVHLFIYLLFRPGEPDQFPDATVLFRAVLSEVVDFVLINVHGFAF